jgi:cytoskeletal protein CcmA (bactofilin family)
MLKRFVPQKPIPPVREEPRYSGIDENNHPANGEEPITTTIIDKPKPMADHGGKDILSSDVEIKGSIKFQKELLIDGKVEGEINSDGVLTIGENADIRGELKSKCTLQGDLKAARLVIEEGATFIGKSEVTSGSISSKSAPARPEVVRSSEPIKAAFGGR